MKGRVVAIKLTVGTFGALKHYFEDYDEFEPEAKPILDMYESTCEEMYRRSKFGICDDTYRQSALIWLAATVTLETLLETYMVDVERKNVGIDFREIKHLSNESKRLLRKEDE